MKRIAVSKHTADRIQKLLPEGRRFEDVIIFRFAAQVTQAVADEAEVASAHINRGPKTITDGLPTIMRVVAWMVHEGKNKNKFSFNADDLGPAAERVREPNFIPMDWNHGAVFQWSGDPRAIGVWYKAEKRWDANAKNGTGAYGVQAYGIMWSWAFPEQADAMLAEQARSGFVEFSVACIPASVTYVEEESGDFTAILHEPVFISLSALDVPPADEDAVGLVIEGSSDSDAEEKLRQDLELQAAAVAAELTEGNMDELKAELEQLKTQLAQLNDQKVKLEAAEARVAELEASLVEAQTARDAVGTQMQEVKTQLEAVQGQLVTANEQLAAVAAEKAEKDAKERYAARFAELPESYRASFDKREDEQKARFESKWTAASESDWEEFKQEVVRLCGEMTTSFTAMSHAEGGALPTGAGVASDIKSALRRGR